MDLNKLEGGNWMSSFVATLSEWRKLVSPVKGRKNSMFAIGFVLAVLVCSLFLGFNYPNKLVANPMDHRQSWFPSVFRDSSRSNSFFKFMFPDSTAEETDESVFDNAGQTPDLGADGTQSIVNNVSAPLVDNAGKMTDLRTNRTQGIVNNGSVPVIDNAGQMPDPRTNSAHGIHDSGSKPVNSPVIDGLDKTTISGNSTQKTVPGGFNNKPPGVVSSSDSSHNSTQGTVTVPPGVVSSSYSSKNSTQGTVPVPPGVVSSSDSSQSTKSMANSSQSPKSMADSSQSPKSMANSSVAPPDLVPSSTELNPQRVVNGSTKSAEKKCDIFFGRWVPDDTGTLYPPGSCPHIDESFNCFINRRPDNGYEKWRWQPHDCNIPRLNATDMLERLRGKRLSFVGDSLNRNMWESLVCILRHGAKNQSRVHEISGRSEFRTEGFYAFLYEDYNCSVEFVRAPFLVQEWEVDDGNGTKKETLRLDLIESSAPKFKEADVIVFNTGHWWTHEKTSKGKDYYQEGDHVYAELNVLEAYRKALTTWAKWVDKNINPNKSLVFFRGYSATHFSGGQWNSGGQCHKESEPIYNETFLTKYPPKMEVLESVLNEMKTPVMYLNITRITDYRKDAHPSIYRRQYPSQEERSERYQDCSHWCLPGVPDTWNELLYASMVIRGKGLRT